MENSKEEYMKIFDYILENYDEIIDGDYFSNDFLMQIRNYVKGKRLDDNYMLNIHKQLLVKHFLNHDLSFNEDTPIILTSDEKCINKAIYNDIFSINYIYNVDSKDELFKKNIIELALKNNYMLSNISPLFLKSNYELALNSIILDYKSADYIDYDSLTKEEINIILKKLIQTNYKLNINSCKYLKNNVDITIHSIRKDVSSFYYSDIKFDNNLEIIHLLIENNYNFTFEQIQKISMNLLKDKIIFSKCIEITEILKYNSSKYINNYITIYHNAINNYPTINSFESVFDFFSEKEWEEYKLNNKEYFSNIFSKICSMIKSNNTFSDFMIEFQELGNRIEYVLKDKYDYLIQVIEKYYYNNENRSKLNESSMTISRLTSLYISRSKENYKKKMKQEFYNGIKKYFKLRIDNKIINKRLIQISKQEIFRNKYLSQDSKTIEYAMNIKNNYIEKHGDWIEEPINNFFTLGCTDLDYTIIKPARYYLYKKYLEVVKLVRRLNQGYIKYTDSDIFNYRKMIYYNEEDNQYEIIYNYGTIDIDKCNEYSKKEKIFKKFLKDIMIYINNIPDDIKINYSHIYELNDDYPFDDEYFEFDEKYLSNYCFNNFLLSCISTTMQIRPYILQDIKNCELIQDIIINNNLVWLWLLDSNNIIEKMLYKYNIRNIYLMNIFNNIEDIININKSLNLNIINIKNLILLEYITKYSDKQALNLLGIDIINKLLMNTSYNSNYSKEYIIKVASELVLQMRKKDKSTVPYINGNYNDYNYSMYNSNDEEAVITGLFCDSCLIPCGNNNDFLHYILINKNGFMIKITDSQGNFIGRAAGFRNGNIIFINQLRTIYDIGGTGYRGKSKSEKQDIIDVLIKASQDIINISHDNDDEIIKIDYVFITKSYLFSDYPSEEKLSDEVTLSIGNNPIDVKTDDWQLFVKNTRNLLNCNYDKCFETDYNNYDLICLARFSNNDKLNIRIGDVEAIYNRPRNNIIVTSDINYNLIKRINKIRTFYACNSNISKYENVDIKDNSIVIIGDGWYIIYNNGITDYCIESLDNKTINEFKKVKELLLDYNSIESINKIKKLNKCINCSIK